MPTLERSNPLPLYYQLKQVLRQQITAGHLAPHTTIPSEPELVAHYRVSRATVRQALTELVHTPFDVTDEQRKLSQPTGRPAR